MLPIAPRCVGFTSAIVIACSASAQEPATGGDHTRLGTAFYASAGVSVLNKYTIGNDLVAFLAPYARQAGQTVQLGSAWGLIPIAAGVLFPGDAGGSRIGVELQIVPTRPDAIATYSAFGGYEIFLRATFINGAVIVAYPMSRGSPSAWTGELGVDAGIMTGTMSFAPYTTRYEELGSGVGAHAAFGLNLMFSKAIGITGRVGFRYLRIGENHVDASSSTGYKCFVLGGQCIKVDWTGPYLTSGLVVTL
jgi:hypothetical protein